MQPDYIQQDNILPLIIAARTGDGQAKEELAKYTADYLAYVSGCNEIPSWCDRDDFIADVMQKIFGSLHTYDHTMGQYNTWANIIFKNHLFSLSDRKKKDANITFVQAEGKAIPAKQDGSYNNLIGEECRKKIFRAAANIDNSGHRKAFLLYFQPPLDQERWADILNVKPTTFRSHIQRGKDKFLKIIRENKEFRDVGNAVIFVKDHHPGGVVIGERELNLLDTKEEKNIISCGQKYEDIRKAAAEMDISLVEFKNKFVKALDKLLERFAGYRRDLVPEGSFFLGDSMAADPFFQYCRKLFTYGLSPRTRQQPYSADIDLADSMFSLFSAGNRPLKAGELISSLIEYKNIDRDRLAEKLNTDEHALAEWLNDTRPIPSGKIKTLAIELGITQKRLKEACRLTKSSLNV